MRSLTIAKRSLLLIATVFLFSACASGPPVDIKQQGLIRAAMDINPDLKGQASPVTVMLFFLKDAHSFRRADFFGLYQSAKQVLGDSLVVSSRFQIVPGQEQAFVSEFPAGVKAIGVIAAFREIESAQWRASMDLPEPSFFSMGSNQEPILINVNKLQVKLGIRP